MNKLILSLLPVLALSACSKEEEELPLGIDQSLLGTGASSAWRSQAPADTTASPLPNAFVASTGFGYGAVQLTVGYPEITGDYARIDFRYKLGRVAPATCAEGTLGLSVTDFTESTFQLQGLYAGADYAFIACIYDASENLSFIASTAVANAGEARRVFTSSETFDGNLAASYNGVSFADGVEGADYRCQALANTAKIGGTWQAVLSSHPRMDAVEKFSSNGPIFNIKGEQVAARNIQFWDTIHSIPMNYDENGQTIAQTYSSSQVMSGFIWSGSYEEGTRKQGFECDNWTSAGSTKYGQVGEPSNITSRTDWLSQKSMTCNNAGHLLCLESPSVTPAAITLTAAAISATQITVNVDFPATTDFIGNIKLIRAYGAKFTNYSCNTIWYQSTALRTFDGSEDEKFVDTVYTDTLSSGIHHYAACIYDTNGKLVDIALSNVVTLGSDFHRIFISTKTYQGNIGSVALANAECNTLAGLAGLTLPYKALIAATGTNLSANITSMKNTYDFQDRFVASTSLSLTLPLLHTPAAYAVSTNEFKTAVPIGTQVWTGSDVLGEPSDDCSDWTSNSSGQFGNVGVTNVYEDPSWIDDGTSVACNTLKPIYCIEQ